MRKLVIAGIVVILASCAPKITTRTYTEKFEGLTQLVLASETKNVDFVETVKKTALVFLKSDAQVQVNSSVTFDFYLDFDKDSYDIKYDQKEKVLTVYAPPIRVKKPVINGSTVSYPERGLLVNEDREAIQILETLTDRFVQEGETLLTESYVRDKCNEKATAFFMDMCKEMELGCKQVKVVFSDY